MHALPHRLRSRLWVPFALAALPSCVWCSELQDPDIPSRAEECDFQMTDLGAIAADGDLTTQAVPVYAAGSGNSRMLVALPDFNPGNDCWWVVAGAVDDELPYYQTALRFDGAPVIAVELGESRLDARERDGAQVRLHGPNGQVVAILDTERTAAVAGSAFDAQDPLPQAPNGVPCGGVLQGASIELGDYVDGVFTPWTDDNPGELRRAYDDELITPWVRIEGAVPEGRCGWVTVREIQSMYFGDLGLFPFDLDSGQPVAGPFWQSADYLSGDLAVEEQAVTNLEVEVIVAGMRHLRMMSVTVADLE